MMSAPRRGAACPRRALSAAAPPEAENVAAGMLPVNFHRPWYIVQDRSAGGPPPDKSWGIITMPDARRVLSATSIAIAMIACAGAALAACITPRERQSLRGLCPCRTAVSSARNLPHDRRFINGFATKFTRELTAEGRDCGSHYLKTRQGRRQGARRFRHAAWPTIVRSKAAAAAICAPRRPPSSTTSWRSRRPAGGLLEPAHAARLPAMDVCRRVEAQGGEAALRWPSRWRSGYRVGVDRAIPRDSRLPARRLVGLVALAFVSPRQPGHRGSLIYARLPRALLAVLLSLQHAGDGRRRGLLRYLDHAAIFLLIAGTYTPFRRRFHGPSVSRCSNGCGGWRSPASCSSCCSSAAMIGCSSASISPSAGCSSRRSASPRDDHAVLARLPDDRSASPTPSAR